MMPNMDGIEATKIIRGMGYNRSIVALTANAVTGQADLFLGNGFDDYISKPIDIRQLNIILNKLIRDKQPQQIIETARKQAKAMKEQPNSDSPPLYAINPRFAEIFVRDALKALAILEEISEKNDYNNEENIRSYIINVHGMKSALANIGKIDLSAEASELETAARKEEINILTSETSVFLSSLRAFVDELTLMKKTAAGQKMDEDKPYLKLMLLTIKTACEGYDENTADKALAELIKMSWSSKTKELLDTISEHLLHSDFDDIVASINNFNKT